MLGASNIRLPLHRNSHRQQLVEREVVLHLDPGLEVQVLLGNVPHMQVPRCQRRRGTRLVKRIGVNFGCSSIALHLQCTQQAQTSYALGKTHILTLAVWMWRGDAPTSKMRRRMSSFCRIFASVCTSDLGERMYASITRVSTRDMFVMKLVQGDPRPANQHRCVHKPYVCCCRRRTPFYRPRTVCPNDM